MMERFKVLSKVKVSLPNNLRLCVSVFKNRSLREVIFKTLKRIRFVVKKKYFRASYVYYFNKYNKMDLQNYNPVLKFFYDEKRFSKIIDFYGQNPVLRDACISDADRLLSHEFNILNGEKWQAGKEIFWSQDYRSGFTWPLKYYLDIVTIDLENESDVKNVWELSRFNHLFSLGKAFSINGDMRYYGELKRQILSWENENKLYKSVNWTCTMEVAIRAINWIFAYYHFKKVIDQDKEFKGLFVKLLYFHGVYISKNLENYNALRNNHYIANLVGLLYLGLFFSDFKAIQSRYWIKMSVKELQKEIELQVNKDGSSYEASTNYQRVIGELFLHAHMIGRLNGIKFSQCYLSRVIKIHRFLACLEKPNGLTPLIGDIDNGRLLIISKYFDWEKRDFSQLLEVTQRVLGVNYGFKNYHASSEEVFWFGLDSIEMTQPPEKIHDHVAFSDGGFYILKNPNFHSTIRCGPLSMRGQGGHSHNDQLSFELNVQGKDFFVDPGSFTYTGSKKLRNLDRSTSHHNTISLSDFEQNHIPDDLFAMPEQTFSKVLEFNSGCFSGEHYGFRSTLGLTHRRKVQLCKRKFTVIDKLYGDMSNRKGDFNLTLDSNVSVLSIGKFLSFSCGDIELLTNMRSLDCVISEGYISTGYGHRVKTFKIQYRIPLNTETKIIFSV